RVPDVRAAAEVEPDDHELADDPLQGDERQSQPSGRHQGETARISRQCEGQGAGGQICRPGHAMSSELSEPIETAAAPEERSAPRQPYPGLRPFNDDEQRLFFGRDQQIREILDRLQQTYFAVVIGGSGSGKSSIVIAGVIPALRKKQLRGSGDFWLAARFTPQLHPMRSLATALAEFIEPKPGQSPDDTLSHN